MRTRVVGAGVGGVRCKRVRVFENLGVDLNTALEHTLIETRRFSAPVFADLPRSVVQDQGLGLGFGV